MAGHLFWLSDDEWERIEPWLPRGRRGAHRIRRGRPSVPGVSPPATSGIYAAPRGASRLMSSGFREWASKASCPVEDPDASPEPSLHQGDLVEPARPHRDQEARGQVALVGCEAVEDAAPPSPRRAGRRARVAARSAVSTESARPARR